MFTLVSIRIWQLKYELKHLGITHSLFLFILFGCFESILYWAFSKYPMATSLVIVSGILMQHLARKDAVFIKMNLEKQNITLFFDYLFLISPFAMVSLLTPYKYCFLLILVGICLISFIKIRSIKQFLHLRFLTRFIPISMFEARSGSRRNYIIVALIAIYLSALSLSWVRGLPLFLLWFVTIIVSAFFSEYEPLNVLRKDNKAHAQAFIKEKLGRYTLTLLPFFLPILFIHSFFQPDIWWINPLFLVLQVLILSLSILYKYATYQPKAYFNSNNPVLIIAGLCIILPFLIPLILFFNFRYYSKAVKNLNYYLD